MTVTTQYRVIAGGSALEERMFPNTPKEMVPLHHEKDSARRSPRAGFQALLLKILD